MFDLATYLITSLAGDTEIKKVYTSSGNADMSDLLQDVASTEFPCVMVDIGSDGTLDYSVGVVDQSVQSFYVLYTEQVGNIATRNAALRSAKEKGKAIISQMRRDASEYGSDCYGVDFTSIRYHKVSMGMNSYGYCFIISCTEE